MDPRLDTAASGCVLAKSRVPTTAGDRDDKAKQTYIRRIAAKPNRVQRRGHGPIHAGIRFPPLQLPPLISRLSLCGLTGRSAPVNLIYPLFRLCLPPASHIFSTWQNLNLSADGVHCCFLWPVSGKRKGWGGRGSFYSSSDGCGRTRWCSGQCKRVYSTYVLALNHCFNLLTAQWMSSLLTMRLQLSNHKNLKFRAPPPKEQIWWRMSRWWVISQQGSGFSSEPLYVDFAWLFWRYDWVGELCGWLLGWGFSTGHYKCKWAWGLNMAAHCCSEMGWRGQLLLHICTRPRVFALYCNSSPTNPNGGS